MYDIVSYLDILVFAKSSFHGQVLLSWSGAIGGNAEKRGVYFLLSFGKLGDG